LKAFVRSHWPPDHNKKRFVVGHSYGCSQVLKLVNSLDESEQGLLSGVVLLSGALKSGPATAATRDGGHWIFSFLPLFVLKYIQPTLSEAFLKIAIHETKREELRESAMTISSRNGERSNE
jgi:pimeloyl-ACP methyl ester carboxylesterase